MHFLGPQFRLLEWYGAELRKSLGNGNRRNMKFDDDLQTIYMDVKAPSEEEWYRIDPEVAREEKEAKLREGSKRIRSLARTTGANSIPIVPRSPTSERFSNSRRPSNSNLGHSQRQSSSSNPGPSQRQGQTPMEVGQNPFAGINIDRRYISPRKH